MTRAFRLERKAGALAAGGGRSYFISRLLRDVVIPEQGLAAVEVPLHAPSPAQETPA
ncbi:hypothetical protein D3C83_295430 [compost metagenome]